LPLAILPRFASNVTLNDGNAIPQVGLGTWKSQPGAVGAAVISALDAGYRHIDCALVYQNEDEIGYALQSKFSSSSSSSSSSPSLHREDIFLTSKIWNTFHSKEKARVGLRRTLRSLQTSYLDLLLIHYPMGFDEKDVGDDGGSKSGSDAFLYPLDSTKKVAFGSDVDYLETYAAMEAFVAEGIVKSIGLSNFNEKQVCRVLDNCSIKPVTNQVEVHPYFCNSDLISYCHSQDVSITAYSPLGSPDRPNAEKGHPVLLEDPVVLDIAEELNRSPAQVLIRFGMQLGLIVIPKSVTPLRIRDNFDVFDFDLSQEQMTRLKQLDKGEIARTCFSPIAKHHPHYPF